MTEVGSVQDYGARSSWPPEVIYVGMPGNAARAFGILDHQVGPFGKPWALKNDPRGWAVAYVEYLCARMLAQPEFEAQVKALHGSTLLCWCTKKARDRKTEVACHARILAEFVDMLNG